MVVTIKRSGGGKRGRPPAGPYEDKRKTLSTRITADLRDKIEGASRASGRSLSQEIELRLERSFRDEAVERSSFGGDHFYALARLVGAIAMVVEGGTGKKWNEDRTTCAEIRSRLVEVLEILEPKHGKPVQSTPLRAPAATVFEIFGDLAGGRGTENEVREKCDQVLKKHFAK